MAKQAWRFVMLVFTPARKAWNLIGGGAGTIATLWLMAHRHGFAAAIVGLSSAVFLLLVAGIRLQRKIDQTQKSNLVIGAPLVPPGQLVAFGRRHDDHNPADGTFVKARISKDEEHPYLPWRLPMKNDPPGHLAEANVIGAWATLSFRREGTEIRQATGVWYKESQRVFTAPLNLPTPPTSAVAGRRDLMADGSEHALDIVFIPYGWDGPPMFWQEEGVALPLESDDRYDILVTLGGQGLPTTTVSLVLEQGEAGHWTVRKVGEGLT